MPESTLSYRGEWWLPSAPEDRQQGTLTIDSAGSARLELVGGFRDVIESPAEDGTSREIAFGNGFEMILGRCGSDGFTLLECTTTSSKNFVFYEPYDHTLSIRRVLRGGFLEYPGEPCFSRIEVEYDYLLTFTRSSTIEATMTVADGHSSQSASSKPISTLQAEWGKLKFELEVRTSNFRAEYVDQNTRRVGTTERAVLIVTSTETMGLTEVDRHVGTIQDLLTLAMAYPCGVRSLTLTAPSEVGELRFEVFNAWTYQAEGAVKNLDHSYAFSLQDVEFGHVVPAWFDLYEKIRVPARMILGSYYLPQGYVGTRLMTACASLEALHRSLYDYAVYSDEEFQQIKAQVRSGLAKKYRGKVQVYNSPSYAERARGLTEKADSLAVLALLTNINAWVVSVREARVNLAHALAQGTHGTTEWPFRLMRVSRALMLLVMMRALELSPECQRRYV